MLFKRKFPHSFYNIKNDENGRYVMVKVVNDEMALCNIYAPNTDDPEFFVQFCETVESFDCADKIIGGDFNLALDTEMDRLGPSGTHERARDILQLYMDEANLTEV